MKLPRRKSTIVNGVDITGFIGRPRLKSPFIYHSVSLTQEQWNFIMLWFPTGNPSQALRELLERAVKFWPSGPGRFR
jgi:hypothetical protein